MANFNKIIDENDKITTDFKEITKECFSQMWEKLGERNFRRWLHTREISKEVKEMIIDYMSEEEKERLPNLAGYATVVGDPTIKHRHFKCKHTQIHETYHFFTRHSSRFNTYLNEGLTEYMTQDTLKEGEATGVSYYENVKMVEFLHSMLGDSLIKAYLLGKDKSFDEKFARLISENPNDLTNAQKEISEFYDLLNKRHELLYLVTKEEIKDAEEHKEERAKEKTENTAKVKEMIKKIVLGKVRQKAQNLEFYQKGQITNLDYAKKLIDQIPIDFKLDWEEEIELEKESIGIIIENSHLLVGLDGDEKSKKKEELLDSVISIKRNPQGKITQTVSHYDGHKFNFEDKDISSKVFQKSFEDNKDISLIDFVDKVINISQHLNPTERELKALISQYTIEIFGEKADIQLIHNLVQQNLGKHKELFDLQTKRERNTVDSKYRKIGDNEYIEKRDNQYFYIQVGKEEKIQEAELSHFSYSFDSNSGKVIKIENLDSRNKIAHDINKDEKDGRRAVYQIQHRNTKDIVSLKNGLEDLQLHEQDDKYKNYGIMSMQDFRADVMISPVLEQIRQNIKDGKYINIKNDAKNPYEVEGMYYTADVDMRSRTINIPELKQDLDKITQLFQGSERGEVLQKIIIEESLDRTYGTQKKQQEDGTITREENVQKAYNTLISEILSGKNQESKIAESQKVLNDVRHKQVEENKKTAFYSFVNDEAREKFEKKQKNQEILYFVKMTQH